MTVLSLILKEIAHRKVNFLLGLLAVATAVALFVAFVTTGQAYRRETRKIQLGMGQNLRIIPKQTSMDEFWSIGFSKQTMPEEYIERFATTGGFSYTHLTATLQKKVLWRDKNVILTGILPEVQPPDQKSGPMTFSVERGTVYIGFEVARLLKIKKGDVIDIFGKSFTVIKCLPESGSSDDIRIYGYLHDIQSVLNLDGRINEIKALECLCLIEESKGQIDPRVLAQEQLKDILPQAKVLLLEGIARVRQRQRAAMEGFLAIIMPIIVVVCGAWIGALAMINIRDRQREIGIMRALGYESGRISILFLGKSIIIGLAGATAGFVTGTAAALSFGPDIFPITAKAINPDYALLYLSVLAAPVFAALCSFIPTMYAVTIDPAITLREE